MQLSKILRNVELVEPISTDIEIKNIEFDSRKVGVGSMFVATRGTAVDGHDFIAKAIEAGAVAVVCEDMPTEKRADVVYINDYDVVYHNDKLACLILYSEQDELYEEIYSYYLLKYGKTKSGNWKFSNYEIDISAPIRKRYDPQAEAGYKSSPPYLYFDSFRGEKTNRITQDMSFIRIMYKDYNLLKEIERDSENTISNGIEGMIQLKKYGIISEEEFTSHKKRLIENHY